MSRRSGRTPRQGGARVPAPRSASTPLTWRQRLGLFLRSPGLWAGLAAAGLYLPTLSHGFVVDDHDLIDRSSWIAGSATLVRILSSDLFAGVGQHTGFWRPLIAFTYWFEWRLFHGAPAGFHVVNLISHAVTSALVSACVLQCGTGRIPALLAGIWFAVLPTHVESVAPITGRPDTFCAAFLLAALWLDRRARSLGRSGPGWAPVVAASAALLSKESAAGFVVLAGIAEWTDPVRSEVPLRARLRWSAPYIAVTLLYMIAHASMVGFGIDRLTVSDPQVVDHIRAGAISSYASYLALLSPWSLHAPALALRLPSGLGDSSVIGGLLVVVALVIGLWLALARRTQYAVPLGIVLVTLAPVTVVGLTQGRLLFGERFLYLPSAGVAWIIGLALQDLARVDTRARARWANRLMAWAGPGVIVVLSVAGTTKSVGMMGSWASDLGVARAKVQAQPEYADGHAMLADQLLARGRDREAAQEVAIARRLDPRLMLTEFIDSQLQFRAGRMDSAIASAERALQIQPNMIGARFMLGSALSRSGRFDQAAEVFSGLERDAPALPQVEAGYGHLLLLRGNAHEALPRLERGAAGNSDAEAHFDLGMALAQLGRMREARDSFNQAVALDSNYYDAWLRLALACAVVGDTAGSNVALTKASQLPGASDGRVEILRKQLEETLHPRKP